MPITTLEEITAPPLDLAKIKWKESLTSRSKPATLYIANQALDFVGYALVLNAFSIMGNFHGAIPDGWLYTLITIASAATLFSMVFCKLPELGNENETLHLNQRQQRFFDNLEMQIENSYIEEAPLILCLDLTTAFPTETDIIPQNFIDGIQLLYNKYFSKTGNQFILSSPGNEYAHQQALVSTDSNRVLIITNCVTGLQRYSENTRIIQFYDVTWIKRITNDYSDSLKLASQTTLKASLVGLNWSASKGIPGLLVVLTGIHALCGVTQTHSWDSKALRAIALITYTSISFLGKGLINNRLKGNDTERELRQFCESIWHKKYYKIKMLPLVAAILISCVSMYPYNIATPITFTKGGLQTIVDELNAIFPNLSMGLSTTVLDINIIAAIVTSLLLAVTTSTQPCYRALANGVHFGNNKAKAATTSYKKTWRTFVLSSGIDSIVYSNNAYYNMKKCWEFLVARSPEFATLASTWEIPTSVTTAAGVFVLASFWCLYKGVDKFEKCIGVTHEVAEMIRSSGLGRRLGLYQEPSLPMLPFIQLSMTSDEYGVDSRAPTPVRQIPRIESMGTLRRRALSFGPDTTLNTPTSYNC